MDWLPQRFRVRQTGDSAATGRTSPHRIRGGLPQFADGGLPAPERRPRLLVIRSIALLALTVTLAYLIWRTAATINLDVWWVSIPLLLLEIHAFIGLVLFTFSLWDMDAAAPARQVEVPPGRVAVLIPTYNEGLDVLLPTVAAAVSLDLQHETWVLDDGRRPEVADLARSLGAHYLTRPDNEHAKAGNVNHALAQLDADFIAVLDADHVATPGFLTNTLGYFDDPDIALVQTPQDFYNLDSFEHGDLPGDSTDEQRHIYHEQALFYRVIQPAKNRWGGAFWCGTNAVVRVAALREIGGIATDTVTEDIHTTIRLHRRGWKTVYHNEVLARGLAATSADQFQLQRFRWGTGAMQVLRSENPLFVSGLTFGQRLTYAKTMLGWFDAWRTLGYLLVPPVVLFTGGMPIEADAMTFLPVFLATFLIQRLAIHLLSRGYLREQLQMVFELARMTPNLLATLTLFRAKPAKFQVTPKGRVGDDRRRIQSPALLRAVLLLSVIAGGWFALVVSGVALVAYQAPWVAYGAAFWLMVNAWFVATAIRRIRSDAFGSERRAGVRFGTQLQGVLNDVPCTIEDLSLSGACVVGPVDAMPGRVAKLTIDPDGIGIQVSVELRSVQSGRSTGGVYGLAFTPGQYGERARLALALFNSSYAPVLRATEPEFAMAAD